VHVTTAGPKAYGHSLHESLRYRQQRSACQITAFSLYLAFLDQLSPPDIRTACKWDRLPYLVSVPNTSPKSGRIFGVRISSRSGKIDLNAHVIVGQSPWGASKKECRTYRQPKSGVPSRNLEHPNREKSIPFVWKALHTWRMVEKVCLLLPHGITGSITTIRPSLSGTLFRTHAVDWVVNLTDYQFFLFEESQAPALVMPISQGEAANSAQPLTTGHPMTDWASRRRRW